MSPRCIPPVYSPLCFDALLKGWRATLSGSGNAERLLNQLRNSWSARELLLIDSGTSALALAIRQCSRLRPGPVALPAWSCYDLATAANAADAEVVLYDLDPTTLGPDLPSLERALALGVSAVVVVHPYGLPVDLAQLHGLVQSTGALLIEDAAQAVGGRIGGRPLGGDGAFGILSFGRGKGLTGGTGGALLLNQSAPAELGLPPASILGVAGCDGLSMLKLSVQWVLGRPALYSIPSSMPFLKLGETIYRPASPPHRLPMAAAGVLQVTLPLQEPEASRRRWHAELLIQSVRESGSGSVPGSCPGGSAGWLRLPVLANDSLRAEATAPSARRLGVAPGYPRLLVDLPGFAARVRNAADPFPGARTLTRSLITLPTHSQLSDGDLERLKRWLAQSGP